VGPKKKTTVNLLVFNSLWYNSCVIRKEIFDRLNTIKRHITVFLYILLASATSKRKFCVDFLIFQIQML
jgi:hypothetical protein